MKTLLLGLLVLWSAAAGATDGQLLQVPTREGISVPVFWVKQEHAAATVVLLPGGAGGIGKLDQSGWPGSANFLIRSGRLFAVQGFNIAMVARPSDIQDLDFAVRIGDRHLQDLHKVVEYVGKLSDAPIWIIGTSRGTISAAALAIAEGSSSPIAGLVLTSSVTDKKPGALPTQALQKIVVPVLVVHNQKDACPICQPHQAAYLFGALKNSPNKKLLMLDGGSGASGDVCEALHYHGFIGIEQQAVDAISQWIKHPSN
ncbi:alpha/beta hydrolase [Undibacterium sp.]|jgi:pimeloyl-ACP methyl ester carboxylesterase|uniref:alpha/beta hydrolase n=1 Tax=Undibacterium sp. TaxID=1914977 RepID=UPI002B9821E9|nr:alpha/beta hydrolase [Undibacterium sp.]HTD03171.1 alpha/beta hydrolase [Undibacterium sp.]